MVNSWCDGQFQILPGAATWIILHDCGQTTQLQGKREISTFKTASIVIDKFRVKCNPWKRLCHISLFILSDIKSEHFQHICRSLTQLKTLDLTSSRFTDEGVSDICSLTLLRSLRLNHFKKIQTLDEVHVACTEFCKSKARNLMVNSWCDGQFQILPGAVGIWRKDPYKLNRNQGKDIRMLC